MLFLCLLLACCVSPLNAQQQETPDPNDSISGPAFPPDPGEVIYVPPTVTYMGQEVIVTDPEDTTQIVEEVDVSGDSTIMYNPSENILTFTGADIAADDSDTLTTVISYTGSDPLIIVLCDSSSIIADTIISSLSDIEIRGEGTMNIEGDVPIIGAPTARILFDSVNMHVRSLPGGHAGVRRRIRGARKLDENGGPALSGFASADFNKTNVTPPEAEYAEAEVSEGIGPGGEAETIVINSLVIINDDGTKEIVTEFTLTAVADDIEPIDDAVEQTKTQRELDRNAPMFNILGQPVDANYRGMVIQQGQTYLLQ